MCLCFITHLLFVLFFTATIFNVLLLHLLVFIHSLSLSHPFCLSLHFLLEHISLSRLSPPLYMFPGQYVVFHVKSTFPLESFDWLILAKNVIVNTGREVAGDIFTQTFTFSIVVNAEMAPGFHILVYTKTDQVTRRWRSRQKGRPKVVAAVLGRPWMSH